MAKVIGQPIDRIDGRAKVTGTACYAGDERVARLAYGVIVGSTIGRGRITGIDVSAAQRLPGVLLVMTHENAPKQSAVDPTAEDRHARAKPQLASEEVRYFGQPIALVVAESLETARSAAAQIVPSYRAETGAFDLATSRGYAPAKLLSGTPDSRIGDPESAFSVAARKIDATYSTPYQSHNAMEPHAAVASWDGDRLTVRCAVQLVESAHKSIASTLLIAPDKVLVIAEYVGGGFGSKLPVSAETILAALAAREIGRPVKVMLSRQQMFHVATHRGASRQRVRLAARPDGTLLALAHESLAQSARADEFVEPVTSATRSLYAAPNRLTTHRIAALDLPVADAMRAPGEAIGLLALEQAIDELAVAMGMDPIDLRIRNEPTEDPEKHVPYSTRALVPCLRVGGEKFGWNRRQSRPGAVRDGRALIGMGVSAAIRGNFLRPAKARVLMASARHATVEMDMTDIGTGSYTIFAQIAAEVLGLPVENVTVKLGRSDYPITPGSGGSFGASSSGAALYDACQKLKQQLDSGAGAQGLVAEGEVKPGDEYKKFSQQAYGAHFAEVAVDVATGEIRLRRMLGVFAAGRILNAKTARSQLIGGMIWGVGSALHEICELDTRYGSFINNDLAQYHVPVHADAADIDAIMLEEFDPHANALGSKGLGELGICGAGAAVANAVYNACGARIRDYPLTPDRVLPFLHDRMPV